MTEEPQPTKTTIRLNALESHYRRRLEMADTEAFSLAIELKNAHSELEACYVRIAELEAANGD